MNTFLTALMFFTRIPVPSSLPYLKELLDKALRFFPLVGIIVGGIGATVLWAALFIFPASLAVLLSMAATIFVTGAFHEDGFADFCDGYGGGLPKDKILEIMKDSRLGTYGTIGLVTMLAAKYLSISTMPVNIAFCLIIAAHSFSRFFPIFLVYTTPYVREDALSKAKPIGIHVTSFSLFIAFAIAALPFFLINWVLIPFIIICSLVLFLVFRKYILIRTGGYTGDVLGALQQLSELIIYLIATVYYNT